MNDLEKLFISELKQIYDSEQQLVEALPEVNRNTLSDTLKGAFQECWDQSRNHIDRIEQVFQQIGEPAKRNTCYGMKGILQEARIIGQEFETNSAVNPLLVNVAQKAQHYQITSYGSLCSWARELGHDRVVSPLKENIKGAKEANFRLSRIEQSGWQRASQRTGDGEETAGRLSIHTEDRSRLKQALLRQLRVIYDGENLLINALAELAYYADSHLLKFAIHRHQSQTEKHVKRVQCVFEEIGETPDRRPCFGLEGIIDDAQVRVEEFLGNPAMDAALIAAAQKAEHYEISAYESLNCWAGELRLKRVGKLLKENLSDEKSADRKLTLAAELLRNPKATRSDSPKREGETAEFLKLATHGS